jgi:hypothetical protein
VAASSNISASWMSRAWLALFQIPVEGDFSFSLMTNLSSRHIRDLPRVGLILIWAVNPGRPCIKSGWG